MKREILLRSSRCEQLLGLGCVLDSLSFCMLDPNGLGAGRPTMPCFYLTPKQDDFNKIPELQA